MLKSRTFVVSNLFVPLEVLKEKLRFIFTYSRICLKYNIQDWYLLENVILPVDALLCSKYFYLTL